MVTVFPMLVLAAHGQADLLVNNAGVELGGTFDMVSEDDFDWLFNINFHGVVSMTRAFLPLRRASTDARLVNSSSIFGIVAPAQQVAYAVSKFVGRRFSEALRHELGGSTVGVTVVHPGGVCTNISSSARAEGRGRHRGGASAGRLCQVSPHAAQQGGRDHRAGHRTAQEAGPCGE